MEKYLVVGWGCLRAEKKIRLTKFFFDCYNSLKIVAGRLFNDLVYFKCQLAKKCGSVWL